ncbi:type II toxin-antitoxin system Phd/YefM family antitoxin [Nonomuraea sp. NPDC051941]|uniref:type II toxin-antitoxin system Phd/YefM family antitoxin n=1 Tax=Nonomuraea sp. NPDC051941 TaxID=3364373 RepID=UPI0037C9D2AE
MPTCSPFGPTRRTSGTRIRSLMRGSVLMGPPRFAIPTCSSCRELLANAKSPARRACGATELFGFRGLELPGVVRRDPGPGHLSGDAGGRETSACASSNGMPDRSESYITTTTRGSRIIPADPAPAPIQTEATRWQLQEAKQHLSEVVRKAHDEAPQIVTKHGMDVVVILDMEEYRRLKGGHMATWGRLSTSGSCPSARSAGGSSCAGRATPSRRRRWRGGSRTPA